MQTELAIVGSLMLVAAVAPFAVAHDDTGANIGTSNVYGTYNGASGVLVQNAPEVGTTGSVSMLCDAEVHHSGDPTGATGTMTEQKVDGTAAKSSNTLTTPDGTFDDGGQGGACHTLRYTNSNWNTGGCPANDVRGQDMLLSPKDQIFVISSCDWEISDSEGLVTCVVNAVLGNRPGDIVNDCPSRIDPSTPNPSTHIACGTDGSGDTATSGVAGKAKGFTAATVPPNPHGCDNLITAQALFVVEAVDAGATPPTVKKATRGWVGVL